MIRPETNKRPLSEDDYECLMRRGAVTVWYNAFAGQYSRTELSQEELSIRVREITNWQKQYGRAFRRMQNWLLQRIREMDCIEKNCVCGSEWIYKEVEFLGKIVGVYYGMEKLKEGRSNIISWLYKKVPSMDDCI